MNIIDRDKKNNTGTAPACRGFQAPLQRREYVLLFPYGNGNRSIDTFRYWFLIVFQELGLFRFQPIAENVIRCIIHYMPFLDGWKFRQHAASIGAVSHMDVHRLVRIQVSFPVIREMFCMNFPVHKQLFIGYSLPSKHGPQRLPDAGTIAQIIGQAEYNIMYFLFII